MADRSGCILLLRKSCTSLLQTAYIVDILFCALCDTNHGLNSFQRVIAVCCLTGKHDTGCAIVDSVCNVGCLCTGRTGMLHHGIQHLCSSDNVLTSCSCQLDDSLLDDRNLFHRDLNTHIATGYHDTVGNFDDLFQVLNTLQALDLGDDLDLGVVLL